MLTIRFLCFLFVLCEDYLINKSSPNMMMMLWMILYKESISITDAMLPKSLLK